MRTSTAGMRERNSPARQRGFTYAMALVAIVVIGILAGVANLATSRIVQAEREQELIFRGIAYRNAIQQYLAANGHYPHSLDDLVKDSHFAHRTYLRGLYPDPMAMDDERQDGGGWRLLRAPDGGISGVSSRSKQEPLKKADFPPGLEQFEQAKSYEEWVFEHRPHAADSAAGNSGKQPMPGVFGRQ